ncbi:hypothetical protein RB597_002453 [Gaeumannomyces tritici]
MASSGARGAVDYLSLPPISPLSPLFPLPQRGKQQQQQQHGRAEMTSNSSSSPAAAAADAMFSPGRLRDDVGLDSDSGTLTPHKETLPAGAPFDDSEGGGGGLHHHAKDPEGGLSPGGGTTTNKPALRPTRDVALGGSALEAFWSGTSFLLASTVLQPTVAGLSNIFGRKNLIYGTLVLFLAGSLVSALANNFTVLIAGRTIQGVGGGSLIALTEVVITDLVPLHARGTWFSVLSAVWSVGTVSGPLIGAGFAQNVSWRWIFWINLPIIFFAGVFVVLFLNQAPIPGELRAKLAAFDWAGSVAFTASSTAFLFGITTGGIMHPWSSWRTLVPVVVGAAGVAAFGVYEFKCAKQPIVSRRIFNNWDMIVNYIMTVFHGAILWSIVFFLHKLSHGASLADGWLLTAHGQRQCYTTRPSSFTLPSSRPSPLSPRHLTIAPAGMAVGIVAALTGHYRWSITIDWALTTLGCGLLWLLSPDTSVAQWIWLNIPVGLGTGMLFPAMALSIQAACEPEMNGQAAAFFSFLLTFGQAIGVAVSGSIFQNAFRGRLAAAPVYAGVADSFSRDATVIVEFIKIMPEGDNKRDLIVAYNEALRAIWVTSLAFAAICFVLSLTIKGYTLNQDHITDQGLVKSDDRDKGRPAGKEARESVHGRGVYD